MVLASGNFDLRRYPCCNQPITDDVDKPERTERKEPPLVFLAHNSNQPSPTEEVSMLAAASDEQWRPTTRPRAAAKTLRSGSAEGARAS